MTLRPQPAKWFEMLVARDDLGAALHTLAGSDRVELQSHGAAQAPLFTPKSREMLDEFEALARRYGRYWPAPLAHRHDQRREPQLMLEAAIARLREWVLEARGPVERIEALVRQREDLHCLVQLFRHATQSLPDIERLSGAGPLLGCRLFMLPSDGWPQSLPGTVIAQRLATPEHFFLLALGLPDEIGQLEQQLLLKNAQVVQLPDGLPADAADAARVTQDRLDQVSKKISDLENILQSLNEQQHVADAIADAHFVRWYLEQVPELSSTENFAWITGWTSDPDEQALLELLARDDIKGLLRVSDPPPGFEPPLILRNPRWMRPFEMFSGMLGVPAAGEADPTRIVAIVGPLMFGYMFGDVGHGAVLLIAGLALRRRLPALRLLIAGGAVSIVFGLLFGSVFALEGLIEPLWLHPMDRPILIIVVPMAGGAALLLAGMCLDALQAYWQRRGRTWWQTGAGLLLCYLGLLGAVWQRPFLWLALAGATWFIAGHGLIVPAQRLSAIGSAIVEFLETMMQLVVNTISFVRVGAFALAHAGLSLAVVGVSDAPSSLTGKLLVLILGNTLIIGLEGLVVGIQTTRLVLFEFFVRFLRAGGRPFKPLAPAVSLPSENNRSTP